MTRAQKILAAAVLTVVGASAVLEALQGARLREQNRLLQQQQASLVEQIRRLQREHDEATNQLFLSSGAMGSNSTKSLPEEQFRELLRLRGTVGVLRQQLADAAKRAEGEGAQRGQLGPFGPKPVDTQGRPIAPENLAPAMVDSDPAGAFAYSRQLSPADRRTFLDSAFMTWARKDTEAALLGVDQYLSDSGEKEAALRAIRSIAPVGIGAQLSQQNGYAVINQVFPGSAAELSGQLHPGDRIVGIAQGDNAFIDARNLPLGDLVQSIRGAPGTLIQLQVLPAGAPQDSAPATVTLRRDQIKYKQGVNR